MGLLDKIFKKGADAVVGSVGDAIDKIFTNDEERAAKQVELEKVKNEAAKIVNEHLEAIMADATKQIELEVQDRTSARTRETEFVKATGHIDYLQWVLAIAAVILFGYSIYAVVTGIISKNYENLFHNILGIIEGIIMSIYNYYFGSSAGSRVKDMKGGR